MNEFKTPRCYKPEDVGEIVSCQLHTFADASDVGYGVVSYQRLVCSTGRIHCALVMSKATAAPLKKLTIPLLELQAATTAVRILSMIKNDLEYDIKKTDINFWTPVLRCVANESERFRTFVANRIAVIRDASDVQQWRYVNTTLHVADYVTRGLSIDEFVERVMD